MCKESWTKCCLLVVHYCNPLQLSQFHSSSLHHLVSFQLTALFQQLPCPVPPLPQSHHPVPFQLTIPFSSSSPSRSLPAHRPVPFQLPSSNFPSSPATQLTPFLLMSMANPLVHISLAQPPLPTEPVFSNGNRLTNLAACLGLSRSRPALSGRT